MAVLASDALAGRTIAVTGAARGIGAGIVEAILDAGGNAALIDLDQTVAAETAGRLDADGSRTLAVGADVTDAAALTDAAASTMRRFGSLSGWVNNAGIVRMGPAEAITADGWDLEFRVNAGGVLLGAQAARQAFAGRGGAIVNIASNAGKVGFPNMAAYNASKAAVINLTRSLAKEWAGEAINVNAVCPGSVATPMLRAVADTLEREGKGDAATLFAAMVPAQLGRHITPLEIGRVVAFLLSDAAVIIRGQAINLDGGETPY
ncbi:MAG: SDR family oxidoreductase [Bauldia sp.]|nr:SDR family oxidoreductase [Bauldia sp.]